MSANHVAREEFLSASSAMDAGFDARASDMLTAVDGNLKPDALHLSSS